MIDHLKAYSYLCGALNEIVREMRDPNVDRDTDWAKLLHDAMVAAERYGAGSEKGSEER